MHLHTLVIFAPLLTMLTAAAIGDWRRRRIPNALTAVLALTGLMQAFTPYATASPLSAIGGLLVGAALTTALFAIGALAGGDVKLLAAAGAWLGPVGVFEVFLAEAVIGMLLVLAQATYQRRMRLLCRNSALVIVNLAHIRELGAEHAAATGAGCRSIDRPLPYAVPVLIATVLMLLAGGRLI